MNADATPAKTFMVDPGRLAVFLHQPPRCFPVQVPPRLDGFEVARRVRRDLADRPYLIAFTGYTNELVRRQALEAAIDLHLVKTADLVQILTLISDLRRRR